MNGVKYLLDTCFILGLYNAHPEAIRYMKGVNFNDCAVSIINEIEILGYAHLDFDDEIELKALLSHLTICRLVQLLRIRRLNYANAIKLNSLMRLF